MRNGLPVGKTSRLNLSLLGTWRPSACWHLAPPGCAVAGRWHHRPARPESRRTHACRYTSVLPAEAQEISLEEAHKHPGWRHGAVLECIMSEIHGGRGDRITAGAQQQLLPPRPQAAGSGSQRLHVQILAQPAAALLACQPCCRPAAHRPPARPPAEICCPTAAGAPASGRRRGAHDGICQGRRQGIGCDGRACH